MSQAGGLNEGGGGGGDINEITGNTGVATPVGGNVNIVGQYTTTTTGSGDTLTISPTAGGFPITPFVVGSVGEAGYQTVQSAVNAANLAGGGLVYLQEGTYTENLTLFSGVDLLGASVSHTIVSGVHTPPASGSIQLTGINFISATHILSSAVAGSTSIFFDQCLFTITSGFIFNLTNWTGSLNIDDCGANGTNDGLVTNSGGSNIKITSATLGAGTTQTMVTSGRVEIEHSVLNCPWTAQTGTNIVGLASIFTQSVTLSNNSTGYISGSKFDVGANTALVMNSSSDFELTSCTIDSSSNPVINGVGPGTLFLSGISFVDQDTIAPSVPTSTTPSFYPSKGFDGQVFLGATNSTGRFNYLTSTGGTITYTLGANSLNLEVTSASGFVVGPASATDNAIVRFDGTTGKLIKNGVTTEDNTGNIVQSAAVSGASLSNITSNTSNTASATAFHQVQVAGSTASDAYYEANISGGQAWTWGLDNSDSDAYVLSANASLGTTNVMTASTAGEINYPLQPAFMAYLGTNDTNATGDGTDFVLGSGNALTEVFDQGSDFVTTGTFTSPVTGRYFLGGKIAVIGGTSIASGNFRIVTSNRQCLGAISYALGIAGLSVVSNLSFLTDMDAADTATWNIQLTDSGGKVDDISSSGAGNLATAVFGNLVC